MKYELTDKEIIEMLEKRLKHLLKSELIRKYDEKNPYTGEYRLDIEEFDMIYNRNNNSKKPLVCKLRNLKNKLFNK